MKVVQKTFLLLQLLLSTEAYKILGIFGFCSHSHFSLGFRLMKELADKGHDVTFVNCFPRKEKIQNLRDVPVTEVCDSISGFVNELEDFGQLSFLGQLEFIMNLGLVYTEAVLKNKNVQELMKSDEEFDLIIMEHFVNDAMAIFHHRFKCPIVFMAPGPVTMMNRYLVSNPSPSSYVPNLLSDHRSRMSFWQRLRNHYQDFVGELFVQFRYLPEHAKLLKRIHPDAPDLSNYLFNGSLMTVMSDLSLSDPVPLQRNVIEIGGYHVHPLKSLPQDIKEYLDAAKEGVILFSMGSNLKSANFEPQKRKAILNVFSKLKQKVLWKFEADLPEKPSNVKIMKWLPQQDILAHPNVVAFISHGGLLGSIEAIYYGVPILGLPVYWDQIKNIEEAAQRGFAVRLNFQDLNEETFKEALNEILDNPQYKKLAKKSSRIMHDQPVKQIDEAVFWMEYVIRHKGAPHLRSVAVDLRWYQFYSADILLFFITIVFVLASIVKFALKLVFTKKTNVVKIKKN